jgi:N-acetylglucosamine-6-phosphate deacetylase
MQTSGVVRGRAFVDGRMRDGCRIRWEDGVFTEVSFQPGAESAHGDDTLIVPGFVDLHVHGGYGADFVDGSVEAVRKVAAFHARHGTTSLVATTISVGEDQIASAIRTIEEERLSGTPDCAEIVGIHLEGPFLNRERCGAHASDRLRLPSVHLVSSWLRLARPDRWMMTIAPELDGASTLLGRFHGDVLFSVGHTEASYMQVLDAFDRGARHVTHLFNATKAFHHREPGVIGALAVSRDATAEVIADGVHVHPVALEMATTLLPGRLVLVTDAIRAAGMPDGTSRLGDRTVIVRDGIARTEDGALAGSTLTMARAVQNMVELAGLPLEQVIPMATTLPARVVGARRKGRLSEGYDADLVILSEDFDVMKVVARGHEVTSVS